MNQHSIFKQLKSLVGHWTGINENGEPVSIDYKLSANDTVLVEDWTFSNGAEALTLFSMDEETLTAIHYCPVGNQPKLVFKRRLENGAVEFEYHSAMNLPDEDTDHAHAFDMLLINSDTLVRNETYRANGQAETNGTTFSRTGSPRPDSTE